MSNDIDKSIAAVAGIDAVPKILEVVCRTTGLGFAAVARVTSERWVACAVKDDIGFGLEPGGELAITSTLCDGIRDTGEAVIIDHVSEDPLWRLHPTPQMYGFQSYISAPIRHRGDFFGTLCAIDPKPAKLRTPETIAMFELFADLIGAHLDAADRLARSEAALLDARATAELREQFIAILGHDLRNPLAGLSGGVRLLRRSPSPERAEIIWAQMETAVGRMAALISDVMDFARGRLGGGVGIELRPDDGLGEALEDVVAEFRLAQPDRAIEARFVIDRPVPCDRKRLAQLLSNLIGNALVHGARDQPVRVDGEIRGGGFRIQVANAGPPIDAETQRRLFKPFHRGPGRGEGLGLGLYIAYEIARAHGGGLTVASDGKETRFTFAMPLARVPADATRSATA